MSEKIQEPAEQGWNNRMCAESLGWWWEMAGGSWIVVMEMMHGD